MSFESPIDEQEDHEHEADHARLLHDPEGHRPAPDLLDQAPEDVAAVERQERKQVDDRQRQADHGEQRERAAGVELERLPRHLVAADDAGDLLALLRSKIRAIASTVPVVTAHIRSTASLRGLGDARVRAACVAEREPDQRCASAAAS